MITTAVCGARIRQARLICHLTRENMADRTRISLDALYRCEAGIGSLTEAQVDRIGELTGFTSGFFSQEPPPEFASDATSFHDSVSLADGDTVVHNPVFEGKVLSITQKRRKK